MVDESDREGALHAPDAPGAADAHHPGAAEPDPGGEPVRDPATARSSARMPWTIAGIALLVAIATAIGAAFLVADARRPAGDLAAVEQATGQFALALTNWDASEGMGETREELRAAGTERFAADVDELFGGTDDLATLAELGARSTGEVRDVLVQRIEGDQAVALAVVVQRVTTEVTEGEEVSLRYAELTLTRDGGAWRVDQVDLVVDALQESAARTDATELPGFGDAGSADEAPEAEPTDEDAP
jgi:hypothetical protein